MKKSSTVFAPITGGNVPIDRGDKGVEFHSKDFISQERTARDAVNAAMRQAIDFANTSLGGKEARVIAITCAYTRPTENGHESMALIVWTERKARPKSD